MQLARLYVYLSLFSYILFKFWVKPFSYANNTFIIRGLNPTVNLNLMHSIKIEIYAINFQKLQYRLWMFTTARPTPQLTVTKIYIYTIYLYVFITVKIVSKLNRLSRTAQTAVTIQKLLYCKRLVMSDAINFQKGIFKKFLITKEKIN